MELAPNPHYSSRRLTHTKALGGSFKLVTLEPKMYKRQKLKVYNDV